MATHRERPRAARVRVNRARVRAVAAIVAVLAGVLAIIVALSGGGGHQKPRALESLFQDDQHLVFAPTATVTSTLDTLRTLGVQRLRITVLWWAVAPDHDSPVRPAHFNASNPAAYGAAAWMPYDRVLELALARGIGVDFDVTAPGPLWAMAHPAPDLKSALHYRPSPREFAEFVTAVGRRYSGSYSPPATRGAPSVRLPRVNYWSIWNEPNQPGWLAPQWRVAAGQRAADSPRLYREYVDAAFQALQRTGHGPATDTILIGELAPEGRESSADLDPIPPLPFLQATYCVDQDYKPLAGSAAALLHCPGLGRESSFVAAHPGLFDATGFSHHPYSFFLAPNVGMSDPNFVPLSDLSRLERALDKIFAAYGVHRQLPVYLTEYGYETNPPNPYRGVSPSLQSMYLNEAQYLAWSDPRVRALSQFLLYDSPPNLSFKPGTPGYWSTFQTGLWYLDGTHKPSYDSYQLPIFIPNPTFKQGSQVLVWGMLRVAPRYTTQGANVEWRPPGGNYRPVTTVITNDPGGFLSAHVQLPGTGAVRISWTTPNGVVFHSRAVGVREL